MSVSLVGIRAHNNITQRWFSVYPEKQIVQATIGQAALTVVFGAKNPNQLAIDVKGEILKLDGSALVGYTANVRPNETHVFEFNLDVLPSTLPFTVQISSTSMPYVGGKTNTIQPVSFKVNGIVFLPPVEPVEPTPETEPMPELPIKIPILSDVISWLNKGTFPDVKLPNLSGVDFGNILGTVGKALGDTVAKPLEGLPALISNLNNLPLELQTFFGSIVSGLVNGLFETGSDLMSNRILSTLKGTPDSVKSVLEMVPLGLGDSFSKYVNITNPEQYLGQLAEGADVMPAIRQQVADTVNLLRQMDAINFGLSLASLGQVRIVADEIQMLEGMFGAGALIKNFYGIRQEKAITKRLEYYFNEVYKPEIPNTQDLINMVVKEKMSIVDFKQYMLKRGFNESWSQLIWDAHFKAPDLDDILTAWRRGVIDETRVDELMILIDLDPKFKPIFDTRKYQDPPLMITRLMFETGAINADDVPKYVHRLGYAPEFESAIVEFILHFQERRYKTRYITQLMTALALDKITEEEVKVAVSDVGFTEATAEVIIKTALLRRKTYVKTSESAAEKALTLGELKKAYVEDVISESDLRAAMTLRSYSLADINIVISLLNKDKIVESEGRRVVVLTIAEMVNAWRYSVIDEDTLRTNLLGRGLDLNEIDILINTKKKSWGLTEGAG